MKQGKAEQTKAKECLPCRHILRSSPLLPTPHPTHSTKAPVVAAVGDGAFLMTGFELATAARHKLPLLVVCLSDGELGMMSGLQRNAGKDPFCTILCGYDPAKVAEAAGVPARRVASEAELEDALMWARERLLSGRGPVFLDVSTAYAFPSFYARGIVNAKAPAEGSIIPPPVFRQPFAPSKALVDAEYARCSEQNSYDLWAILERAATLHHASSDAFVLRDGHRLRYAQLYKRVTGLAQFLVRDASLVTGDSVGVLAPNVSFFFFLSLLLCLFRVWSLQLTSLSSLSLSLYTPPPSPLLSLPQQMAEIMETHYAAAGVRATVLNLNYRLAPAELAYILDDALPSCIFCAKSMSGLLLEALETASKSSVQTIVWIADDTSSGSSSSSSEQQQEQEQSATPAGVLEHEYEVAVARGLAILGSGSFSPAELSNDELAELGAEMYYTSGTTGRPKGVVLTHKNGAIFAGSFSPLPPQTSQTHTITTVHLHALGCATEHRLRAADVWGHFAPMFHLVDAYAMFSITMVGGLHCFEAGVSFDASAVLDCIEANKVTVSNMPSTMIVMLMNDRSVARGMRDLSSMALLSCGGAPLSRENTAKAIQVFDCEFFLSYGMTEW